MAIELADGAHALELTVERGTGTATFHPAAVETPRGVLLLDTGLPGTEELLVAELEDAGLSLEDVRLVVLTHQDGDHAGSTAAVVDSTGALVAAHERAAPYVDGREQPIKGGGDRYPPVGVDVELVDGVRFRTAAGPMLVVDTPGHAPGHVSLYLPEAGLLLAADALTADSEGLQGPNPEYTLDSEEAARSIGRLAGLDVDRTLCFHGGLVDASGDRIAAIHDELTG